MNNKKQRGPFTCLFCQKGYFTCRPKGEGEKYCSRACSFEHKRAQPKAKPLTVCIGCGGKYQGRAARGYCSDVCRKKVAAHRSRNISVSKKQSIQRTCVCCGNAFVPEYGNKRRVFCSDKCANTDKAAKSLGQLKEPEVRRASRRLREKRLRAGAGIKMSPAQIFERDNWTCQLCGLAVAKGMQVPAHDAPTIDHRVPLMAGGEHCDDNVQCAHFICNVRKAGNPPGPGKSL